MLMIFGQYCGRPGLRAHLLHHHPRHALGEEEGAFQVGRHDFVIGSLAHFQQVRALARGHAGVVDQQVDAAAVLQRGIHQPLAVRGAGGIGLHGIGRCGPWLPAPGSTSWAAAALAW